MAAKKPTTWVKGLGSLVMFGLISGLLWSRAAVDVQAVGDGAEGSAIEAERAAQAVPPEAAPVLRRVGLGAVQSDVVGRLQ